MSERRDDGASRERRRRCGRLKSGPPARGAARADPDAPAGRRAPDRARALRRVRRLARDRPPRARSGSRRSSGSSAARARARSSRAAKIEEPIGLTSHTEEMRARGIVPGSKLINVSRVAAGVEVAAALRLDPEAEVLRIERLRLADGEPIAIEVLFLNAERFDGITASLGDNVSFYQLLHSDYGVELDSAEETIEAVVAGAREARLLDCAPGSALLQLSRLTTDTERPPDRVRAVALPRRPLPLPPAPRAPQPAADAGPALRPATAADAAGLADVFVAAWQDAYPGVVDDEILELARPRRLGGSAARRPATRRHTVVAEAADGSIVGFIRFGDDPEGLPNGLRPFALRPPRLGRPRHRPAAARARGRGARGGRAPGRDALGLRGERAGTPLLRRQPDSSPTEAAGSSSSGGRTRSGSSGRARREEASRQAARRPERARRPGTAGAPARVRTPRPTGSTRSIASGYPAGATLLVVDARGRAPARARRLLVRRRASRSRRPATPSTTSPR